MVFSDTRGVMVETGRRIDQVFAGATKRQIFDMAATLEFSLFLCPPSSLSFWPGFGLHIVYGAPGFFFLFLFLILMDGIIGLGCDMYMAGYAIYFGSISYYCFLFVFSSLLVLSLFFVSRFGTDDGFVYFFCMLRLIIHFALPYLHFFLIALPRLL